MGTVSNNEIPSSAQPQPIRRRILGTRTSAAATAIVSSNVMMPPANCSLSTVAASAATSAPAAGPFSPNARIKSGLTMP
ncbi:hypothetical protein G6F22_021916 [Rhizopus arrhizus]|uniref:Uncharacterized protein n=1 Tax=Rhizopus delemar TaxID=936053 RepID=A0A9P7BZT9_9FUNG|nr:hypothetical protein G6F22_021916 [Rhizopus arrhizus]KAG0904835.1 hypothetical protein G6F32_017265 [Rhizopus arrhizus]KAG1529258.1 hypothetical protein G6F50_018118 [Rhizopus delemar]